MEELLRTFLPQDSVVIRVGRGRVLDNFSEGHVQVLFHHLSHLGDLDPLEASTL